MTPSITWNYNEDEERILWLKERVFSNHLILERLVLQVYTEDLIAFRMVCRPWYMASLERFQKEATIVLLGKVNNRNDLIARCGDPDLFQRYGTELGIPKVQPHELSSCLEEGRKVFNLEQKLCFQNYKIKYGCVESTNWRSREKTDAYLSMWYGFDFSDWTTFWVEFGPKMRHLTLEKCMTNRSFLRTISMRARGSTTIASNLERLVLKGVLMVGTCGEFRDNYFYRGLKTPELISHSLLQYPDDVSNLKQLSVYCSLIREYRNLILSRCVDLQEIHLEMPDCWSMFCNYKDMIDMTQTCTPLRSYGLDSSDNMSYDWPVPFLPQERSYAGLISLNYPKLESLSLHLEPDIMDYTIKRIVETYSDRLKTLKLSRYPFVNSPAFEKFPFTDTILFRLTHLELFGNLTTNLNFLLVAPALRTVVIDLLCYDKVPCVKYDDNDPPRHDVFHGGIPYTDKCVRERKIEDRPCTQLKDLESYYEPFSGNMVEASDKLRKTPSPFRHSNLQHLEIDIQFDLESLSTLAQWMPNITTLKTVLNNDTLNQACYHWPKLRHLKLLFGSLVDDNGLRGTHSQQSPSANLSSTETGTRFLADMSDLHHFELENLCEQPQLTDVSAQHVFMKMAKLHFLIICSAQMTELAMKNLEWIIPHVKIGSHSSNNKLKCCGYTQFFRRIGRLSA